MARTPSISSQDILTQAYDLLMEVGPSNLTFERLGKKVGLVPAALIRRFNNKKQLMLEIDRYALELTNQEVFRAIRDTQSPIEAIIAQFTAEMSYATTIERFANGQEFLLHDFRDKELYDNYRLSFERRHLQIAQLLMRAQQDGLLVGIDNINELARQLEMIVHGAGHVWAMTAEYTIDECIRRYVHLTLKPYMSGRS
ncbi:MAG TPA: TetR/AcrR family transcriptional regulator [Ktedonobacteraceae bacterium]|nr:TetR/AcrR family transcriptional regulator [Ktedonobacteraceae bacterium]